MAAIYIIQDKLDEGEEYLRKTMRINPNLMNVHFYMAQFLEKKGDLIRAVEEYRKELENIPHHFRASYNLSLLYRNLGDIESEKKYLEMTIEINPEFPLSYLYLARLYLHQGRDYHGAIDLAKKGISLEPETEYLPIGYFLLADLYNRVGENALARKYSQKGKKIQASVLTKK